MISGFLIGLVLCNDDCNYLSDDVNVDFDCDDDGMESNANYCPHQRHERNRG